MAYAEDSTLPALASLPSSLTHLTLDCKLGLQIVPPAVRALKQLRSLEVASAGNW